MPEPPPPHDALPQRLAEMVRAWLETPRTLDDDIIHYMETTAGEAAAALEALEEDETLRELLVFPDETLRISIEHVFMDHFEQEPNRPCAPETVAALLGPDETLLVHGETPLRLRRELPASAWGAAFPVEMSVTPSEASALLARCRLAWRPCEALTAGAATLAPDRRALFYTRCRAQGVGDAAHARPEHGVDAAVDCFLGTFARRLGAAPDFEELVAVTLPLLPRDAPGAEAVSPGSALSEEAGVSTDPANPAVSADSPDFADFADGVVYAALQAQKAALLRGLKEKRAYEEALARSNFETLSLTGWRPPTAPTASAAMVEAIDRVCVAVYGRTAAHAADAPPPLETDLGAFDPDDDLDRLMDYLG